MKDLAFKEYVRKDNTLESYGTVRELAGKGGTIGLIPKNVADASKRLVVIIGKKDGTSLPVSCSPPVSKAIRDKTLTVGQLSGLSVLEVEFKTLDKDGNREKGPMICMPSGNGVAVKPMSIDKIKEEAVEAKTTLIDLDELVAF